jgi:hypothetical protein
MKMLVARVALAASVALATLIAAEAASAQPLRHQAAPEAYDTQANPNYGFGPRVTVQPSDVVSGNRVIGRDPDPFVRDQILRGYNSGDRQD